MKDLLIPAILLDEMLYIVILLLRLYLCNSSIGVKQVLDQPNMNMTPGKHYSFSVAQMAWHLIAGS